MIYSMTGFGKSIVELPHRKITVEIKSLNSKQLDLSMRIPQIYKELEMDIRSPARTRQSRFFDTSRKQSFGRLQCRIQYRYYQELL